MKTRGSWLMFIVAVVLLFVAVSTGIGQKSNQTPQRWEYKIVVGNVDDAQLNEIGAAGWELSAVGSANDRVPSYYFKRTK
jgi:hypothetical protein